MTAVFDDVRYALRMLGRRWGFTAVAVLVLGTALGVTITVFALAHAVVLKPLPYAGADRLVRIGFLAEGGAAGAVGSAASIPKFQTIRDAQTSFAALAADYQDTMTLGGVDPPVQTTVGRVSANFFAVLGVPAVAGRTFTPDEEHGAPVAVITDRLGRTHFGGAAEALGRAVRLDDAVYTVVGVVPSLPVADSGGAEIYIARPFELRGTAPDVLQRGVSFLRMTGRLNEGVSLAAAARELEALAARYRDAFPANADARWQPNPVTIHENISGPFRPPLLVLAVAAALVLLIACANVANLLTTRFVERRREIALRGALGAGRSRVVRLFLVESALVSLAGAVSGLALAAMLLDAAPALASSLPLEPGSAIDGAVVAFAVGLGLLLGGLVGIYPAVQASRPAPAEVLRDGGRTQAGSPSEQRVRSTLVSGQVALTLVLLASAALLLGSFFRLQRQAAGFDPSGVFTATVNAPASRYPDAAAQHRLYARLAADLAATPGVTAAAVGQGLPLSSFVTRAPYARADGDVPPLQSRPLGVTRSIGPGYFGTLRIPLLRGRDFTERDAADTPQVLIVSASTAARLFGSDDPIGRQVVLGSQGGGVPAEVVGVAGDVRSLSLAAVTDIELYRPLTQRPRPAVQLAVRTAGDPAAFAADARRVLGRIDPELPLVQPGTLADTSAGSLAAERLLTVLTGGFAAVALVLAAAGVFSVLAYVVHQRTPEIGIRMALGADRGAVLRMVTGQTLRSVAAGLVIGLIGVAGAARVLAAQLYGVGAADLVAVAAVLVVLVGVAVGASVVPARRAARVDPVIAMRAD